MTKITDDQQRILLPQLRPSSVSAKKGPPPPGVFSIPGESANECRLMRLVTSTVFEISQQGVKFKACKFNDIQIDEQLEARFANDLKKALQPVLLKWIT